MNNDMYVISFDAPNSLNTNTKRSLDILLGEDKYYYTYDGIRWLIYFSGDGVRIKEDLRLFGFVGIIGTVVSQDLLSDKQ